MTGGSPALFVLLVFSVLVVLLADQRLPTRGGNPIPNPRTGENPMEETTEYETNRHLDTDNDVDPDDIMRLDAERLKSEPQLAKSIEENLLKMFGLKARPRPRKKAHIPKYILDLYRYHTGEGSEAGLRGIDTYAANTMRTFTHHEHKTSRSHHVDEDSSSSSSSQGDPYHKNSITFYFNVSSIPDHEEVKAAELRLYRHNDYSNEVRSSLKHILKQRHRVDIYEIIHPATRRREAITRLLDTRVVNPGHSQWESFDLHPAVLRWRETPHLNHGLEVHISTETGEPTKLNHVRLRRSLDESDEDWSSKRPILVTYSDDGKGTKVRTKRRTKKRRAGDTKRRRRKWRKKDECRRHQLYVDFSDVGWDDWIVAPPGYEAYYCQGECRFPFPDYMNTTNHAIVQNLVHSVQPKAVPKPCCVPTELSPISMLYLDEYDKVVLKNYQDMVVQGCGCR